MRQHCVAARTVAGMESSTRILQLTGTDRFRRSVFMICRAEDEAVRAAGSSRAARTSHATSTLRSSAAPMPPCTENFLGQPMFKSTAAKSRTLGVATATRQPHACTARHSGHVHRRTHTCSAARSAVPASALPSCKTTLPCSSAHVDSTVACPCRYSTVPSSAAAHTTRQTAAHSPRHRPPHHSRIAPALVPSSQ